MQKFENRPYHRSYHQSPSPLIEERLGGKHSAIRGHFVDWPRYNGKTNMVLTTILANEILMTTHDKQTDRDNECMNRQT